MVTIIPIVIGAFSTITKGLQKGLEVLEVGGRVETIQTTTLLRSARILRRFLETWGDLLSLNLQWKTISVSWCEKLLWVNNNNNNNPKNKIVNPTPKEWKGSSANPDSKEISPTKNIN